MKKITSLFVLLFSVTSMLFAQKMTYCDSVVADYSTQTSGTKVYFTTKSSGSIISQEWNFGDGTSSTDPNPYHVYSKSGTYTPCVYLKITNLRDSKNPCVKKVCKSITIQDPCANFNPSFYYKVDSNGVATFEASGSSTSTSYTYKWDLGDNTSETSKDFKHTYKPGTYKVCVTITDPTTKCSKTVCQTITVNGNDPCKNFNPGADLKIDSTGLLTYGADSGSNYAYFWDFGDSSKSTTRTGKYQFKRAGTYKVCVKIYHITNKCYVILCKSLTFGGNTDPCVGFSPKIEFKLDSNGVVTFWGAGTTTNNSYTWSFGDGTSGTGIKTTHTYKAGTYKFCVTITNSVTKCTKTICETITIKGNDPCKEFNPSFGYKVDGTTVVLEAVYGATFKYSWDFGNNTSGSDRIQKIDFKKSGTYKICVTITDSKTGCKKTICQEIVIKEKQSNNDPCKNFNPKIGFQIEDGGTVNFSADGGKGASFNWNFGDGTKGSDSRTVSHTYTKSGKYNICVTVYDAKRQCKKTICFSIEVTVKSSNPCENFKPDFTYTISGNKIVVTGSKTGIDYAWSWGDKSYSTGKNADHTFKTTGKYTVCMSAYDSKTGCKKTICKTITLKQRMVGPGNNDEEALIVYPNPADQKLSVVTLSTSLAKISVKDIAGNEVLRYDVVPDDGKTVDIIVESLPKGMYFITLEQDGKTETTRFMK